jgi:hypothetical protein
MAAGQYSWLANVLSLSCWGWSRIDIGAEPRLDAGEFCYSIRSGLLVKTNVISRLPVATK